LSDSRLAALRARSKWVETARPNQIILDDNTTCDTDLVLAGRGMGKTRMGAEDCWWFAYENPGCIYHVIAPTRDADLKGVCFEGESGVLSKIPYEMLEGGRDKAYNKSELTIKLTNGSLIKGFSATEPDRLRGPQCHRLWGDELAAWENFRPGNAEAVLDMAMFGLRLGKRARAILTTTPKPYAIIRKLINDSTVRVIRGTTYDNLENLSPNFRNRILKYEGTKLGRQEIHAEVFDLEEGGVIPREHFQLWPADKPLPMMSHIIISLDTAFTERTADRNHDPDPSACSVWGAFTDLRPTTKRSDKWNDTGLEPVGCVILLDRWADRLGFPELLERVHAARMVWYGDHVQSVWGQPLIAPPSNSEYYPSVRGRQADELLIEKKGSGISLLQVMANQNVAAHPFNPGNQSKLTRLHAVSPVFAQGLVFVQESDRDPGQPRVWARPLIDQIATFRGEGTIAHDDDVDTTTQAMLRFMAMGHLRPKAPEKHWEPPEPKPGKRTPFISVYS
jgi:predicted phage terminase large subunit-like protein